MLLLLTSTALAVSVDLLPVAPASVPPPIEVAWTDQAGRLFVEVRNPGPQIVTLDWNGSVVVTAAGVAVPVVPGSTTYARAGGVLVPMTIPPGAKIQEEVIRIDRLRLDVSAADPVQVGPMAAPGEAGPLTMNVAVTVDGAPLRLTQTFLLSEVAPPTLTVEQMRSKSVTLTRWSYLLGGAGLVVGGVAAALVPLASTEDDAVNLGVGAGMAVAGGFGAAIPLHLRGRLWERRAEAAAAVPNPAAGD